MSGTGVSAGVALGDKGGESVGRLMAVQLAVGGGVSGGGGQPVAASIVTGTRVCRRRLRQPLSSQLHPSLHPSLPPLAAPRTPAAAAPTCRPPLPNLRTHSPRPLRRAHQGRPGAGCQRSARCVAAGPRTRRARRCAGIALVRARPRASAAPPAPWHSQTAAPPRVRRGLKVRGAHPARPAGRPRRRWHGASLRWTMTFRGTH